MKVLLIDDLKNLEADRTVRTFQEGIEALQEGPWDVLLLDHDLGDPDPRHTGYDILCWLELHRDFLPGEIKLVTWNAPGREKMRLVLRKLYGDLYF